MTNAVALKSRALDFVDYEGKSAIPAPTFRNAEIALGLLGVNCSYDIFHDRRLVNGAALGSDVGQVSDDICLLIRSLCRDKFKFDPKKDNTWDAINLACRRNSFHPVLEYLRPLKWDGTPRLDTWMAKYMGAPDTPFIRAVSRMALIASVRRVRVPGTKFDYIIVLESPEGYNKSSALALLYGAENFSDQSVLGLSDKELQEAVRGRWGLECADLSGMRRADVERVKAQLSRQEDRTRPAYGRAVIDTPRSTVFWGSTNDENYLRSQTGNRRFLPVPVQRIDLAALKRDRDQLWAEAAIAEDFGDDVMLPKELWADATREQEDRTQADPWIDALANVSRRAARGKSATVHQVTPEGEERISSHWILRDVLGFEDKQLTAETAKRLGMVMRKLGWSGPRPLRIGGHPLKGYARTLPDPCE